MAATGGYPGYFIWTEEHLKVLEELSKDFGMEFMTPAGCPKAQAKRLYEEYTKKLFPDGKVPYNLTLEAFQEKLAELVKARFHNTN